MVKIAILGAAGNMGQQLIRSVLENSNALLSGAVEFSEHPELGQDAVQLAGGKGEAVKLSADVETIARESDVMIDFSSPKALDKHVAAATDNNCCLVIGTTGYSKEQYENIQKASATSAMVLAANFSTGVTLLSHLVQLAARSLGEAFNIEIVETHHKRKKDAPSGTALRLAEAAAEGRELDLEQNAVYGREGAAGPRGENEIGIHAVRGGDVVGEHTVSFYGAGERIELVHKAASRRIFADGAVRAALWTVTQKPGLYSMEDVLNL